MLDHSEFYLLREFSTRTSVGLGNAFEAGINLLCKASAKYALFFFFFRSRIIQNWSRCYKYWVVERGQGGVSRHSRKTSACEM